MDLQFTAVDIKSWVIGIGSSTDRRSITVQRILDDQLSGTSTTCCKRLPVNVKWASAGVDQSTVDRQRCAIAKNKTAIFRTIYGQIPVDGYVALNNMEVGIGKGHI